MPQPVRPLVQLPVSELFFFVNHRHGFWTLLYLLLKQLVYALVARILYSRVVPLDQDPPPLLLAQQIDFFHLFLWIRRDFLQHSYILPCHLLYSPPIKQISVIQPPEYDLPILLPRMQLQIKPYSLLDTFHWLDLQIFQPLRIQRCILQGKRYLIYWRPIQPPLWRQLLY